MQTTQLAATGPASQSSTSHFIIADPYHPTLSSHTHTVPHYHRTPIPTHFIIAHPYRPTLSSRTHTDPLYHHTAIPSHFIIAHSSRPTLSSRTHSIPLYHRTPIASHFIIAHPYRPTLSPHTLTTSIISPSRHQSSHPLTLSCDHSPTFAIFPSLRSADRLPPPPAHRQKPPTPIRP